MQEYFARTPRAVLSPHVASWHVDDLMSDVRQADRNEWVAALGCPMELALREACGPGQVAMTCFIEKTRKVLAVFGAQPMPDAFTERLGCSPDAGLLWFAATNLGYHYIPDFAVLATRGLDYLHLTYPTLTAFVDDRNVLHHQWLVDMGFKFAPQPHEIGPWSLPFWRVTRRKASS